MFSFSFISYIIYMHVHVIEIFAECMSIEFLHG